MPDEDFLPPAWAELVRTRESLARIEAQLSLALGQLPLFDAKLAAFDARLYALEQARLSTAAATEANKAELNLVKQTIDAYELPPPFFKAWKARVDAVVSAFEKNTLVVQAKQELRKSDLALLGGISATIGFAAGALPTFIQIIRSL